MPTRATMQGPNQKVPGTHQWVLGGRFAQGTSDLLRGWGQALVVAAGS